MAAFFPGFNCDAVTGNLIDSSSWEFHMHETLWGDLLWLWGDSAWRHGLFILIAIMIIGAVRQGWIEADNAERLNRRLRKDEERG